MRLLPTGLSALAVALLLVIAYQALAPVAPVAEPAPLAAIRPAPATVALPAFAPPLQRAFAIINERSAFDPARQPVDEPRAAGPARFAPPDVTLVGVAIGAGMSVALLKRPGGQAAISARTGQDIDGWELASIGPDFVVLRSGATDFTIRVRRAAGLSQPRLRLPRDDRAAQ
ncbi:MAG: hypothetical protein WDN03_07800 [Rhizomicrobium sp.]